MVQQTLGPTLPVSRPDKARTEKCACACDHEVQFYERDDALIAAVSAYAREALQAGASFLIIGTPPHRTAVAAALSEAGVDVDGASASERYVELDAATTLSRVMTRNTPDPILFGEEVGAYITRFTASGGRLCAFGEMVTLLWERGQTDAALKLEELWNELGARQTFRLLCAYPMRLFASTAATSGFQHICRAHARVIPTESMPLPRQAGQELLRGIALLQQRAVALEAEVAERKRVELALRQRESELRRREAELRVFVETATQGLHWVDANGVIMWANAAELEMLGYPSSEYLGRPIADFHADEGVLDDVLTRLKGGEKLRDYEARLRCKDGTIKTVLIDSSALWENGRFVHTQCFTRDVTEQRRVESTMRHWAAIVESSDDAILSKNLDGIITSWNPGAQRLFGYAPAEVIGRPITMLMPPERVAEEQTILARLRRGERIEHFETVRRRRDGTPVHVSLTISPVKDINGRIVGASKIARDISGQRRVQEALKQARDELEQRVEERTAALTDALGQMESFSYALPHDLRAPLRAMLGYAEMLRDEHAADLNSDARHLLERILAAGARMGDLITDVLAYARVNRQRIDLTRVSVADRIREVVQHTPELQPERSDVVVTEALPPVYGNDILLAHVFSNLLGNAAKFVAPGTRPRIEVSAAVDGPMVRIAVTDNGIGIKPEYQGRLFNLFERLGADARYQGTGIGLAIVRRAVERMGGTVAVESDGCNGSTFFVTLPAIA